MFYSPIYNLPLQILHMFLEATWLFDRDDGPLKYLCLMKLKDTFILVQKNRAIHYPLKNFLTSFLKIPCIHWFQKFCTKILCFNYLFVFLSAPYPDGGSYSAHLDTSSDCRWSLCRPKACLLTLCVLKSPAVSSDVRGFAWTHTCDGSRLAGTCSFRHRAARPAAVCKSFHNTRPHALPTEMSHAF